VAAALSAMTLGGDRRVILVDGVERWRQGEVEEGLVRAMSEMPPGTTLALFAREEAREKAPPALHQAVKRAGGQVVAQVNVKPWQMVSWTRQQASRMGLALDDDAANALVEQVGQRQQRLLRELEKLALEGDGPAAGRRVSVEDIHRAAARSAEWRAFSLADALLEGNTARAILCYLRLRRQGERISALSYPMAQRLREALVIAGRLRAGESAAEVRRGLRLPARAGERLVAEAARADPDGLRRALAAFADLELDSRGGAALGCRRSRLAALGEETHALGAIERIARREARG
jgi:DNA polymerase-3 subunit delta